MGGRGSPVGTTKVRLVPSVACESLLLLKGVQRQVGVEAVGVIGRGGRMEVVKVVASRVGIGLVVERCDSDE